MAMLARPFEVVSFDLMHTLIWGRGGHWEHVYQIYRKHAGLPNNFSRRRIDDAISEVREGFKRVDVDHWSGRAWPAMNIQILLRLNPDLFRGQSYSDIAVPAEAVHAEFQSVLDNFVLSPHVFKMLERLQSAGIKMCLGSNQEPDYADRHLARHGLDRFFPEDLRFTSGSIDQQKPSKAFIDTVADRLGVEISQILHIGNSPGSDVPLVKHGCQVIMFDHDAHYHAVVESKEFRRKFSAEMEGRELLIIHSAREVADTILRRWQRRVA